MDLDKIFKEAAETYLPELDWLQLKAQGIVESNLNPSAKSPAGAVGIMQIMPATAKELGLREEDLYHPERNILAGAMYMAKMMRKWRKIPLPDRWFLALASYNSGYGDVRAAYLLAKALGYKPTDWVAVAIHLRHFDPAWAVKQTVNYVARVKDTYRQLKEGKK